MEYLKVLGKILLSWLLSIFIGVFLPILIVFYDYNIKLELRKDKDNEPTT